MGKVDNASSQFGEAKLLHNTNAKTNGASNTGLVSDNSNVKLTTTQCILNILSNSNIQCETSHSELFVKNSSNVKLFGPKLKTNLYSNTNFNFEGNDTTIGAGSNSNFKGKDAGSSLLNFKNNSNVQLESSNAQVTANNNSNLRIRSKDSEVTISNTSNHNVRTSSEYENGEPINKIELSAGDDSHARSPFPRLSAWFSSRPDNVRVNLDYVKQAKVDGPNYSVGIFNFTLKPKQPHGVELRVKNPDISVKVVEQGIVTLTASNGSEKQRLLLKAPVIKTTGDNGTFNVDFSFPQSNV